MTPAAIVSKLWNYCNVLRDDGMSYGDYVEQLTYLLFLKMADERTKPPYNQPSAVPAKYNPAAVPQNRDCGMSFYDRSLWLLMVVLHWPTLLKKDGDDLFDHYRHMLESLGKDFSPSPLNSSPIKGEELWRKALSLEKGLLGLIFNKSQNKFQDPSKLRRLVVDLIDTFVSAIAFTLLNDDQHLVATRLSPSSLNSSIMEDPHPYPSPLEGEGQRERGLHHRRALERDMVFENWSVMSADVYPVRELRAQRV